MAKTERTEFGQFTTASPTVEEIVKPTPAPRRFTTDTPDTEEVLVSPGEEKSPTGRYVAFPDGRVISEEKVQRVTAQGKIIESAKGGVKEIKRILFAPPKREGTRVSNLLYPARFFSNGPRISWTKQFTQASRPKNQILKTFGQRSKTKPALLRDVRLLKGVKFIPKFGKKTVTSKNGKTVKKSILKSPFIKSLGFNKSARNTDGKPARKSFFNSNFIKKLR